MKKASYRPRGGFWPGGIVAQNTCFFVIAASMELLSGCAIITAYEKAVNRIRILVVGRTPPVRPRRQRRLFLSPLKCIAGGKAGLTVPHSGWVIAPNSAWQQGQDLQQKRLKSQDFRRFHGITTNPLSSSMALVVLLPSPRPVHGHCRSAFATGASASVFQRLYLILSQSASTAQKPQGFSADTRALLFPEGSLHGPHFSNHHLLPDPPVQRHRWLLSIRRPCSPVTPAWFWQG